ncbi:hypothetical protein L7F22_060537 [Adiantum nelumboides]|nr:hypothetical protein [Adiantum nelumboides]
MQGDWALPNWFVEGLPAFFLPPGGRQEFTTLSNNYFQDIRFLNLVNTWNHDHLPKPRIRDFGGAWKAALQSAFAVIPWQHCNEPCGKERTFNKDIQHRMNNHRTSHHAGVQRSLKVSSHSYNLYSFLEHLSMETNSLCFPAALAWSNAIMPPLEKLPSKLLPTQLDKAGDATFEKEGVLEETVESVDISQIQLYEFSGQHSVVVEPKTGFQFPAELCPDPYSIQSAKTGKQVLAGVGLRGLTIMKLKSIKIYAFGLYIRPDVLKAHLSDKYGAVSSEELKHDPRFFADLLSRDLGMTVRLIVHYKALKMGMVRSAFDTSLRNRLKKMKGTEDDEGLETFASYFSQNLLLPRGTIIDFKWLPGGQFRTEIDGHPLGTIRSLDFCRAFFDQYIGDPPVSSKAKEEICEKLSQILQTS